MSIMGLETPVPMPTMNVYNTDLMKMYIAGVKELYDTAREEMKDFMKQYLDFYSPIAGDTQAYNDMTIGGARNMINQMYAQGIDPYKNPEARAAIALYIASRPTGVLNAMKQNAENRKIYDQAVALARMSGKLDPAFEQWALKQAGLDNFSTVGPNGEIRTWDRLAPDISSDMTTVATPYFEKFKKDEKLKSDITGYNKWGVSDDNQRRAIDSAIEHLGETTWGRYKIAQANEQAATILPNGTPEERKKLVDLLIRELVQGVATQYFQPKYEVDPYYKSNYDTNNAIRQWRATTGSAYSGGGSGSRTNGQSRGGAHGDSGKYSEYASITFSTEGKRSEYAKKNKVRIYNIQQADGSKKPIYGEYIPDPNNKNRQIFVVLVLHGGDISYNGNKYRRVTLGEIQTAMIAKAQKRKEASGDIFDCWDAWNSIAVNTGNDDKLSNITIVRGATGKYLYSVELVMKNAKGIGTVHTGKNTRIDIEKMRKAINNGYKVKMTVTDDNGNPIMDSNNKPQRVWQDYDQNIISSHQAADVELKNGHVGKYLRVIVDYGDGPKHALYKLGEYDLNGNMTSEWASRMAANDRLMSAETTGEGDAVEIGNY